MSTSPAESPPSEVAVSGSSAVEGSSREEVRRSESGRRPDISLAAVATLFAGGFLLTALHGQHPMTPGHPSIGYQNVHASAWSLEASAGAAKAAGGVGASVAAAVGPVVDTYQRALEEHYALTTAIQAFVLVGAGDLVAQVMEISAHPHGDSEEAPAATLEASLSEVSASGVGALEASAALPAIDPVAHPLKASFKGEDDECMCQPGSEDVCFVECSRESLAVTYADKPAAPAQQRPAYDPMRTLRMGVLGLVIGGIGTSNWLQFLEGKIPGHDSVANVLEKAVLDACLWAPLANTGYLVATPLLEGKEAAEVSEMVKERFVPVMKTELLTFFPYNLVSFSCIPPLIRPFSTGFVSLCFGVYLSWVTHLKSAPPEGDPRQEEA